MYDLTDFVHPDRHVGRARPSEGQPPLRAFLARSARPWVIARKKTRFLCTLPVACIFALKLRVLSERVNITHTPQAVEIPPGDISLL